MKRSGSSLVKEAKKASKVDKLIENRNAKFENLDKDLIAKHYFALRECMTQLAEELDDCIDYEEDSPFDDILKDMTAIGDMYNTGFELTMHKYSRKRESLALMKRAQRAFDDIHEEMKTFNHFNEFDDIASKRLQLAEEELREIYTSKRAENGESFYEIIKENVIDNPPSGKKIILKL